MINGDARKRRQLTPEEKGLSSPFGGDPRQPPAMKYLLMTRFQRRKADSEAAHRPAHGVPGRPAEALA